MTRVLLGLLLLLASPVWAQVTPVAPTNPAPTEHTVATPLSIKTTVTTIGQLTTAIAAATCGDLIPIDHTVSLTDSGTSLLLPAVGPSCAGGASGASAISGGSGAHAISGSSGASATTNVGGDNYITITTDLYASLPSSSTRVTTANASLMPTLTAGHGSNGFFQTAFGAHHWRLLGLNLKSASGSAGSGFCPTLGSCGVLNIQSPGTTGSDVHHIIIDRVLAMGDPTTGSIVSARLTGRHLSVLNSIMGNNFDIVNLNETQAIAIDGAGPFLVQNNELGPTAAENIAIGGSLLSFPPGVPSNIDVNHNYVHKLGLPVAAQPQSKNLFEIKQAQYFKVDSNVFDTAYFGAQQICIQFISMRGSGAIGSDAQFTNNWVRNCPQGLGITVRPAELINITGAGSDAGTGCSGGACVKLTLLGACDCATGDLVEVKGLLGLLGTDANGSWMPITKVDDTHVTLPVAWAGHAYAGGNYCNSGTVPCAQFWFQGTPVQRVKITNNLWTNVAGACCNNSGSQAFVLFTISPANQMVPAVGSDASLSTTGNWNMNDYEIAHNTVVNPPGTDTMKAVLVLDGSSGLYPPYTVYKGANWAVRDNVFRLSYGASSIYSVAYNCPSGFCDYGTLGLNRGTDPLSRDFSHNIGYKSTFGDESTKFTGSDSWIAVSTGTCAAVAVLVDCAVDTIAAAALQAGSPGHVAASDGTDVGFNATTLASKLSGVSPITP